jgi:hypothetical protein
MGPHVRRKRRVLSIATLTNTLSPHMCFFMLNVKEFRRIQFAEFAIKYRFTLKYVVTNFLKLVSNYCQGQENVDLYIHTPIRLHGVIIKAQVQFYLCHCSEE